MNVARYWRHTFGKLLWQKMIVKLNIGTCQFVNYVRACSDCALAKPPFLGKIAVPKNLEDIVMDKCSRFSFHVSFPIAKWYCLPFYTAYVRQIFFTLLH